MGRPILYDSETIIALEDVNFLWNIRDVKQVEHWWNNGESIWSIGKKLNRDPDEVAILLMDMIRRNLISYREGGAWGSD